MKRKRSRLTPSRAVTALPPVIDARTPGSGARDSHHARISKVHRKRLHGQVVRPAGGIHAEQVGMAVAPGALAIDRLITSRPGLDAPARAPDRARPCSVR